MGTNPTINVETLTRLSQRSIETMLTWCKTGTDQDREEYDAARRAFNLAISQATAEVCNAFAAEQMAKVPS